MSNDIKVFSKKDENDLNEMDWCPLFKTLVNCPVSETAKKTKDLLRTKNAYDVNEEIERRRLAFQANLTRNIDIDVLNKVKKEKGQSTLNIMDIGCNDGSWLYDRLQHVQLHCRAVGVDINEDILKNVKNTFPSLLTICADCESEQFIETVYKKVPATEKFDIVIISMLLLHVKSPLSVLRNVRKLLKSDGILYIRDMDDGLSIAYPDTDGVYERIKRICNDVKYTGYRQSGREIYGMLQQAGFKNIKSVDFVVDVTQSTPDDYDFRENLFNINFGFLPGDLKLAYADDVETYRDDLNWLEQYGYGKLNEMFHTAEFYFRMGLIGFTATI